MNAFKNILNKLYSEDNGIFAILKAENKIELAAIDDLDSALNKAELYSRVIIINEAVNDSQDLINKFNDLRSEAELYWSRYEDIINWFTVLKESMDELELKLNEYETLSDELGIDPNNSDSYSYGDKLLLDMQDEYREYDSNNSTIMEGLKIANQSFYIK